MVRLFGIAVLAGALSACAQVPQWSWSKGFANLDFAPRAQVFNFDWQLSGDPQIAPLQVFDDGRRTWLQFAADQTPPAVFRRGEEGDILLQVARDGAYLVLEGVWPHVLVRGGHLVAHVRRVPPTAPVPQADTPAASAIEVLPVQPSRSMPAQAAVPAPPLVQSALQANFEPAPAVPHADAVHDAVRPVPATAADFAVSLEDGNLRLALVRWAKAAGWTFGPEHWAVDVDIPLAGAAAFGATFKSAVRHLLAATELGDRPLQPCFYANQVLRVVPFAQRCDRSTSAGAV